MGTLARPTERCGEAFLVRPVVSVARRCGSDMDLVFSCCSLSLAVHVQCESWL